MIVPIRAPGAKDHEMALQSVTAMVCRALGEASRRRTRSSERGQVWG